MELERKDQGGILRFAQDDSPAQNDRRERAVLNRIPKIKKEPDRYWRQVFFICDEYHEFATAGQNDPNGDEKLSRFVGDLFLASVNHPERSPARPSFANTGAGHPCQSDWGSFPR